MKFDLIRPCPHCPFRTDRPGYLGARRAGEIADGLLLQQATFSCHETNDFDEEDGEVVETTNSQHCAGALIFCERHNRPNQMMRIAERLGLYDQRKLDKDAPVCQSRREFVQLHTLKGRRQP
jgi:hypothetical protein